MATYLPARRRWIRVRFSSLRCFFFAIRLRRFLMTEPTSRTSFDSTPVGAASFAGSRLLNNLDESGWPIQPTHDLTSRGPQG